MKMATGLHLVSKLSMSGAKSLLTRMCLHDTDMCLTIALGEIREP